MFMIDYVTPGKAKDDVKDIYALFPPETGVPTPLQLYSASPKYLVKQMAITRDYLENNAYEFSLLAALRYVGASTGCFKTCIDYNGKMLMDMGLSEEQLAGLLSNPQAAFKSKDAAMIAFTAKAVADPDSVTRSDIDTVRAQGWTDEQIFECTAYAAQMTTVGTVYRTFAQK